MNLTVMTEPASEVTGEAMASRVSLVLGEIADTASVIGEQEVAGLARHLNQPGRVFVAGAGRSGLVLRMAAMRLMHLGLNVHVVGDTTTVAISSGALLLVASGSGTTSGVVKAAAAQLDLQPPPLPEPRRTRTHLQRTRRHLALDCRPRLGRTARGHGSPEE